MTIFYNGFIGGSGFLTEYQLWNTNDTHTASINIHDLDIIIGPNNNADFRRAPYHCHQQSGKDMGFTICGYDKDIVEKLAMIFIEYLHRSDPEKFLMVPPMIQEKEVKYGKVM